MSNHDPNQPRQAGRFAEKATPASQRASAPPPAPAGPVVTQELIDQHRQACDMDFCVDEDHKFCSPDLAEPIAAYSVHVTGEHATRDGAAWVGIISRDGNPVIAVENSGTGGCNMYHPTHEMMRTDPAAARAELAAFRAASAAACPRMEFEQEDVVTGFLDEITGDQR